MFDISEADLSAEGTRQLLALHLAGMHADSPMGSVFAMGVSELQVPEVTVWSAREGSTILGIGAMKALADGLGEIKSMRTHPDHLRRGVGAALLTHIINEARSRGVTMLSLETGSGVAFEPALTLYRSRGFINGAPFGDYKQSGFNQFLHLAITP